MNAQTDAQIYLADQRGCSQTNLVRSYHTFNFGAYVAEGRQPFGPLQLLNDDTLRAGAALNLRVEDATDVILLPLEGGLEYHFRESIAPSSASTSVSTGATSIGVALAGVTPDFLEPGQVGILSLPAGTTYSVTNPYETETITFLQFWLRRIEAIAGSTVTHNRFLLLTKNTLLPLFGSAAAGSDTVLTSRGFIGQYDGRGEGTFTVPAAGRNVFVVVLRGVFEVANRLLHEKDGLSLRYEPADTHRDMEFEALSDGAILLLIDMPLDQ
ncbi:pirin [Spirosoma sp. KUDC1026]|uniref:pirin n=1 Tax=Spirosoma sp. KUDC1026 TaxID=2745947 RepID=UPI00159BE2BA|nr:pirin [Spirosoma sp. KUDC1026]QKZ13953.1 pirin [Spirosoma sp. KUDC1026]